MRQRHKHYSAAAAFVALITIICVLIISNYWSRP